MRVIYFSQTFFSDCDFPLIRALQQRGVDVRYYMPLYDSNKRQALLDIKALKSRFGIFRASEYPEMSIYKDYIDLNRVYFLNIPTGRRLVWYKLFWRYVVLRFRLQRADLFHYTWQFRNWERLLSSLPCPKVMTVHDPLSHSHRESAGEELERRFAFSQASRFVLLSQSLSSQFADRYAIDRSRISFARLGEYEHLHCIPIGEEPQTSPYILFFGQISPYKGIEYLCKAMVRVHERHPEVRLLIAGRGEIYFDFSPYESLEYIELRNQYLSAQDLASLLRRALFCVCPYTEATQSGVIQTAFSCDLPVIASHVGALPEAVMDGVTGLVVPPCDEVALAEAIGTLLDSPETVASFRQNIAEIWRPAMSWSSIADAYMDCWNQVTKECR